MRAASARRRVKAQQEVRLGGVPLPLASQLLEEVVAREHAGYLRRREELAPLPPKGERSAMTEKAWQAQVVAVAKRLGYWTYHPHLSLHSERGWPDLTMLHVPWQRATWVELKRDDTHLTEKQVEVIDRMLAIGLEVHVWRPWHGLEHVAKVLSGTFDRHRREALAIAGVSGYRGAQQPRRQPSD